MTRILLLGINFLLITSCIKQEPKIIFSEIIPVNTVGFNEKYAAYCKIDPYENFEENAVLSSFVGAYSCSIEFAEKRDFSNGDIDLANGNKVFLEKLINDSLLSNNDEYLQIAKLLEVINRPKNLDSLFTKLAHTDAKKLITKRAEDFHFLLINEAHYCAQHRLFTASLLKPLWEKGYRYLALEALDNNFVDYELQKRGYPILGTGYYIQESTFSNLVRKALKIGYKLIPYETKLDNDGTLRDKDQAQNIFNNTLKIDSVGKVLVHAGYDHIVEVGNMNYDPMGSQLKKIAAQEILTVEQRVMTGFSSAVKSHPYYKYVIENYTFKDPIVFHNKDNEILVDPVHFVGGIDIQVYHPITKYFNNRPIWLLTKNKKVIMLPKEFNEFNGFLIQAVKKGENNKAIPFDQFIVKTEKKSLFLENGEYELRLIDCEGTLVAKSGVNVRDK